MGPQAVYTLASDIEVESNIIVRGHFVMLIEVSMHLISCNPVCIWITQKFIHCLKTIVTNFLLGSPITQQTEEQCTLSFAP